MLKIRCVHPSDRVPSGGLAAFYSSQTAAGTAMLWQACNSSPTPSTICQTIKPSYRVSTCLATPVSHTKKKKCHLEVGLANAGQGLNGIQKASPMHKRSPHAKSSGTSIIRQYSLETTPLSSTEKRNVPGVTAGLTR